ncbi:MAG: hypothetical protein U5K76_12140 [Woeseiaceae bacterium]|nr:hypothetical protein [Woeseiaceae bacterium]
MTSAVARGARRSYLLVPLPRLPAGTRLRAMAPGRRGDGAAALEGPAAPPGRAAGDRGRPLEIVARFVLIALVVLPVLPDRTFGPYDVFNPFNTWLLVVLIVAMNLAGFIAFRLVGTGAGSWLAGVLGGLIYAARRRPSAMPA